MSSNTKIAIVGGGVIGFSTGVNILKSLSNVDVTIISELFSPNTTGDNAAGIVFPYHIEGMSMEELLKWYKGTTGFCNSLIKSGEAAKAGIFIQSGFYIGDDDVCVNFKDVFLTYEVLDKDKAKQIMPSINSGASFITTYILEGKRFIPWLVNKFRGYGGKIEVRKVKSLNELSNKYDVIINCTGLAAGELVKDDQLHPIRGQVMKVKAPFIQHFFFDMNTATYIIPGFDTATVGGTFEKGSYDQNVDLKTKKRIMESACRLVPNLKNCEFVKDWVGLRPGRTCPRLEREVLYCDGKTIPLIHNYGHAGLGLTLCWGCAEEVVSILKKESFFKLNSSKL